MKSLMWHGAACLAAIGGAVMSFGAAAAVPAFSQVPAIVGDANFCMGKDDGSYRHPDCRVRYACSGGASQQVNCPDGQVFDAAKNRDDDPKLSYCSAPQDLRAANDCSLIPLK